MKGDENGGCIRGVSPSIRKMYANTAIENERIELEKTRLELEQKKVELATAIADTNGRETSLFTTLALRAKLKRLYVALT